jgi:hypothetical protein
VNLDVIQIEESQRKVCGRRGVGFVATDFESMTGMAISTSGKRPVNGLRHPAVGNSNGWYIWFGEKLSAESDFFRPLCARHVYEEHAEIGKLLGLPPGFRFLFASDYLDIWYDPSLLNV